jgi:chromosome partitioning protein
VDARTRHAVEVAEELRKPFPTETFQTAVRENVRPAEAPSFGQPVTLYDPKSAGAEDYRALAVEVLVPLGEGTA